MLQKKHTTHSDINRSIVQSDKADYQEQTKASGSTCNTDSTITVAKDKTAHLGFDKLSEFDDFVPQSSCQASLSDIEDDLNAEALQRQLGCTESLNQDINTHLHLVDVQVLEEGESASHLESNEDYRGSELPVVEEPLSDVDDTIGLSDATAYSTTDKTVGEIRPIAHDAIKDLLKTAGLSSEAVAEREPKQTI